VSVLATELGGCKDLDTLYTISYGGKEGRVCGEEVEGMLVRVLGLAR
jgi:hypothetical protein